MLFNSYIFILLFLPLTIIGYFSLNHFNMHKAAGTYLLIMSLWFYAYFNISYFYIIVLSLLVNFALYTCIYRARERGKAYGTYALMFAILFNLGLLFYYKYYDFFLQNLNALFGTDFILKNLLLPLGISFFTFQQISFIIDSYRSDDIRYDFLEYALFVSYFPQLIAGPIVTHDELIPQFMDLNKRRFDWDNFSKGIFIFAIGLSKKILIADTFGNAVNFGYANLDLLNSSDALLITLGYTIQIYFDFSGYCDMALGIGKMMNIDLPINFNSPYKSCTIVEFWQRWHITLTRFFTKYVYFPLGGNQKGHARTYANIMIVFLVSGLWHGANWTFVLWGALHGLLSIATRFSKKLIDRTPKFLCWLCTFAFVNLFWVFFRADSIADAAYIIGRIFDFNFAAPRPAIVEVFTLPEFTVLSNLLLNFSIVDRWTYFYLAAFLCASFFIFLALPNSKEIIDRFKPTVLKSFCAVFLIVWCIFSMSGVSTFLYFNF